MKQTNKKQYKHIRTGKIVSISENGTYFILADNGNNIPSWIVMNSNDWEEIIEVKKDYEILSLRTKGFYISKSPWLDLDYMLNVEKCDIFSIKRLSDGEVFTVGDKTNAGIIKEFQTHGNHVMVKTDGGLTTLDGLCIKKQPLFTTEDGVDIFEGDKYYYVDENIELFHVRKAIHTSGQDEYFKYFSTKEKAEEYISLNKPKYSEKQVTDYLAFKLQQSKDAATGILHTIIEDYVKEFKQFIK